MRGKKSLVGYSQQHVNKHMSLIESDQIHLQQQWDTAERLFRQESVYLSRNLERYRADLEELERLEQRLLEWIAANEPKK